MWGRPASIKETGDVIWEVRREEVIDRQASKTSDLQRIWLSSLIKFIWNKSDGDQIKTWLWREGGNKEQAIREWHQRWLKTRWRVFSSPSCRLKISADTMECCYYKQLKHHRVCSRFKSWTTNMKYENVQEMVWWRGADVGLSHC